MAKKRTFQDKLRTYAEVVVRHGLNIQPGQILYIHGEIAHRDLAVLVAEFAYKHGARFVDIKLEEPRLKRLRVLHSSKDFLGYFPSYPRSLIREIIKGNHAKLYLWGEEYPDILEGLDPDFMSTIDNAWHKRWKRILFEAIDKNEVHWCIAAGATPRWAQKVFPSLAPESAHRRLWNEIFQITRSDTPDALERWRDHSDILELRSKRLTRLGIEEVLFESPKTHLRVSVSKHARFYGGSMTSTRKRKFEPNIPSEEVFTTPDWRGTNGHVAITRPVMVDGTLVKDLLLEFKDGRVTDFSCSSGKSIFKAHIERDDCAKQLGEVALVGINSPVFEAGHFFYNILFDENAACHIALGEAYLFCISGGESMDKKQLQEIGFNSPSRIHTDLMISDETTNVFAITRKGKKIPLLRNGKWQKL